MSALILNPCAWCSADDTDPRWASCDCRQDCASPLCLPGFPAADLEPGTAIWHPDGTGVLDVITADGPDEAGMMRLGCIDGPVTVAADWPVTEYTAADADFAAFLVMVARDSA